MPNYIKPERLILKAHPEYNERWVQARIADDPKILGLGDLVLLQQERVRPSGGRLDLLFQDTDKRRYEVEIQLGSLDESHIIRTIEYWDIERKRYPQYDHCAVIIAKDVTSRFLNIVSLFNGAIPLVAIKMQAYMAQDNIMLIFTTVMDELTRGLVGEDEGAEATPTNRAYWENKASRETVAVVDILLTTIHEFDPGTELKYNKFYIGLTKNDRVNNFVTFVPARRIISVQPRIPRADEVDHMIEEVGLEPSYDKTWSRYRINFRREDFETYRNLLKKLMQIACELEKS